MRSREAFYTALAMLYRNRSHPGAYVTCTTQINPVIQVCVPVHTSFIPLLPNYLPICISIFSGHFPDEPGLATPLVFFLQLFQKRTFRINAETFMCQICPSCHPTNSVKALTPTSGPASSYLHPPLGLLCPGTLLPCYPIR